MTNAPAPVRWGRIDAIHEGQSVTVRERVTQALVDATAQVTGDFNPVHVDAAAARAIGQSRAVAHGVILLGMLSRVIGMHLPGPGAIWFNHKIDFLAPVSPGDDVELTVTVSHVSPVASTVMLDVLATRLPNTPAMRGTAQVRVPSMIAEMTASDDPRERVVLVTGGGRGLGRTIAETLASRGPRVVINYRSDAAGAEEAVAAIRAAGGEAVAVQGDVATLDGARRVFDATFGAWNRIDGIVHNATPPIHAKPILETDASDFRAYFDTYVVGLHELARLAEPPMRERAFGRIVAISSSYTTEVPAKFAAYTTGKAALVGLCRALAVELGPSGITVNVVSPSILVGQRTDDLGMTARDIIARKTPLRRLCRPEDVAEVVAFLLGPGGAFVSGADYPVTGGVPT